MPADRGATFKMASLLREVCCPLLRVTYSFSLFRGFAVTSSGLSAASKKKRSDLKEEKEKVQDAYRHEVRQIVKGFRTDRLEYEQQRKAAEGEQQKALQLERELQERVIEDVKLGNDELAAKRRRRLSFNRRRQNEIKSRKEEAMSTKNKELRKKRIAVVQQALEESKDFITLDNLDEKIAHALEHETNYNFALTTDGEKIISNCPPGNMNTELPGDAAFMNAPAVQRERRDDDSQQEREERKKMEKLA